MTAQSIATSKVNPVQMGQGDMQLKSGFGSKFGAIQQPIALESQLVMTLDEDLDQTTLKRLSGELVIAVDQNGGVYFKRLRLHGHVVVLESANSSVTTSSEILSLTDEGGYPKLTGLRSVVGVLFDLPTTD